MAVIITPVKGYTGPGVAGLHFDAGHAETDDPAVIAYARRHGYTVEDEDEAPHPPPSDDGPDTTDPAPPEPDEPEPVEDDDAPPKQAGRSRSKTTKG
ncbi:hypothetical protein [Streptomyces sp. NPDC091046]|uniref:hypothetical protein n=1 Tax=Streptomyces sp. NPDC091046 TaxID=3365973 RepID=UPI003828994D